MKIKINKFLYIFYSIMNNEDVYSIDIVDIVETIKIIFASDEFKIVSPRLAINEFSEREIENHKFTQEIDEDGIISFNVPDEDRKKILKNNAVDAGYIQQAINKRAFVKYFEKELSNVVEFKYDNPNGVYNMPLAEFSDYNAESKLYTDGELEKNKLYKNEKNNTSTRNIKLNNATFSFFLYYIDGLIDKVEVRADYKGGYTVLLDEIKRILSGVEESFNEVIKESPKVYKFKVH